MTIKQCLTIVVSDWICYESIQKWLKGQKKPIIYYTSALLTIGGLFSLTHLRWSTQLSIKSQRSQSALMSNNIYTHLKAKAVMLNQDNCCYLLQTIMKLSTVSDFINLPLCRTGSDVLNTSSSLSFAAICWRDRAEEKETAVLEVVGTRTRRLANSKLAAVVPRRRHTGTVFTLPKGQDEG